jgi:hypothetical protein
MNFKSACIAVAAAATFIVLPASAHHSHGNYQMTEYTHLTGVVQNIHFVNPHTWLFVEVMGDDGDAAVWAVETAGVGGLARQGITEETVKAGDTVSMRCHQLRDGSNGCLLGWLTSEDGIEREWD